MSFLKRINFLPNDPNRAPESWLDLDMAGEARYWDGAEVACLSGIHRTAAIYLFGYAAELALKVAYFRKIVAFDLDTRDIRRKAEAAMGGLLSVANSPVAAKAAKGHNLLGWYLLLREQQAVLAPPDRWTPHFELTAQAHIQRLEGHWSEQLRYRHETASSTELGEVYASASWLWDNRNIL